LKLFYGINSEEQLKKLKSRHHKGHSTFNRTFLYFHLIERLNNKVIGWCGYHTWAIDHDRAELGYEMNDEKYMGKGLMSEALSVVLEYGFKSLGLYRVEALISPYNKASLRLLEKNNFVKEGILKQHYKVNGVNEDSHIYALLNNI